ncbi:MAG: endospore germination permease [Desulfitobacterium sp.]|nr:endospore germination permease [Desulfitobacterium sp.]
MERISTHQFIKLAAALVLGQSFLSAGSLSTMIAGRDGWIATFLGFLAGIPFILLALSISFRYPGKNFLQITEQVLGKWLGKIIGVIYILLTIRFGTLIVSQGVDMYTRTVLPIMSHYVIVLGILLIIIYLFYSGIEVLGRFSEVIYPIIFLSLIFIAIFIFPHFEHGELFPILADGLVPIIKVSVQVLTWPLGYILFLAGLLPFIPREKKEQKKMYKGVIRAVIIVSILSTLLVVVQISTFGPFEAARLTYGLLVLSNMVEVLNAISGVEVIFTLIWMGSIVLKSTALIFAGYWGIQTIFGIKGKIASIFLCLLYILIPIWLFRGSALVVSIWEMNQFIITPFVIVWLLILWGGDKWKRRKKAA